MASPGTVQDASRATRFSRDTRHVPSAPPPRARREWVYLSRSRLPSATTRRLSRHTTTRTIPSIPAPGGSRRHRREGGSWRLHRRVARGTERRVGGQRPRAVAVAPCVPFLDARRAHPRIAVVALADRWFAVRFAVQ